MYNIEIVCSYAYYDKDLLPFCSIELDKEVLKENVEEFSEEEISNALYQANLLESFNLTDFDEVAINKEIDKLYLVFKAHDRFKKCMKKVANSYISEDLSVGLMLLFSYDYFFLTHECICEYLKTKEMPTLDKLEEYIKKKTDK
jgi:hypothetical protein